MKKNNSILVMLALGVLLSNCSSNSQKDVNTEQASISDSTIQTSGINYNSIFKSWLMDTLSGLTTWKDVAEKGVEKKDFSVSADSLSLTTDTYYSSQVDSKAEGEVLNMLDLLKEYDETPQKGTISFLYENFYSPSSVEQLKHDYTYEIKNIVVILSEKKKIRYNFIRGRLNHKEVVVIDKSGKEITEQYDFIWDGDKLIKKKLD